MPPMSWRSLAKVAEGSVGLAWSREARERRRRERAFILKFFPDGGGPICILVSEKVIAISEFPAFQIFVQLGPSEIINSVSN